MASVVPNKHKSLKGEKISNIESNHTTLINIKVTTPRWKNVGKLGDDLGNFHKHEDVVVPPKNSRPHELRGIRFIKIWYLKEIYIELILT